MDINIELRINNHYKYKKITKKAPLLLSDLAKEYENEFHFGALIGSVNYINRELDFVVNEDSKITLYDMSTELGANTYMSSLLLIYLKAIEDCYQGANVIVENSLNQGLFTKINIGRPLLEEDVLNIQNRMKEIVSANLPILKKTMTPEEAKAYFVENNYYEKAELAEFLSEKEDISYNEICGYKNFFYGYMLPSTGYVTAFELRKYRGGVLLRFPNTSSPDGIPEYRDDFNLYREYARDKKWRQLVGVDYVSDLNKIIKSKEEKALIAKNESLQENMISEIALRIVEEGKRIVLISGPSSSGKTTFAKRVAAKVEAIGLKPIYLGTDDYFLNRDETPLREDGKPDYESISAIDVELFNSHLNALLRGEAVDIPEFNFLTGKKEFGKRIEKASPKQAIIIEGIHSLNGDLTKDVDEDEKFRIYISPLTRLAIDRHNRLSSSDSRILRRMVRDKRTRGKDATETLESWNSVRLGEEKYVFPYSNYADVVFNTSMTYETSVLKKYVKPLLEEIKPSNPQYGEAIRLLHFLEPFAVIEDEEAIPSNSILREFIGKRNDEELK